MNIPDNGVVNFERDRDQKKMAACPDGRLPMSTHKIYPRRTDEKNNAVALLVRYHGKRCKKLHESDLCMYVREHQGG